LSIRNKIALFIIVSAVLFSAILFIVTRALLNQTFEEFLLNQGKIIGTDVSVFVSQKLVPDNSKVLKRQILKYLEYSYIEYIIVEDSIRQITLNTFEGDVPPELIGANNTSNLKETNNIEMVSLAISNQLIKVYDILTPINKGQQGFVRVGIRKNSIDKNVWNILFFIGIVVVGGIIFCLTIAFFFLTLQISKPVLYLTKAAEEISLGNLESSVEINVKNELRGLATAIDRMRESLRKSIEKMRTRPANRF
jgi:nitrogen fixation/metabolism regulation signal transduction histidine kinase